MEPGSLRLPSDAQLRRLLRFSVEDGSIWLKGQRMLLVHTAALGTLRAELIGSVGPETTRRHFTRMGYAAGSRDGLLAKQLRGDSGLFESFVIGPQLHMLEGAVQVTPIRFEADENTRHFYGEFRWDRSWEAELHKRGFGISPEPVCWMLTGYASGYTSEFMGRTILFKEVKCMGCGDAHCYIVGKPQEEWSDADAIGALYFADASVQPPRSSSPPPPAPDAEAVEAGFHRLIGRSAAFRRASALLRRAASTNVNVLLIGETGVGKEMFVSALRALSDRADKPFVAVNCAAIPHELLESELFGAEKGAYTGAPGHAGRFERAHGGILFLDEIGELPPQSQAKLLRAIQESEVERLGGSRPRKVDVRLVAATNRDLEAAVREGRFRADLLYRLNVYPIVIPPLRERLDDIEPLANAMLDRFAVKHGRPRPELTDHALAALRAHHWPGNVRELENVMERAVILSQPGCPVDAPDLFADQAPAPGVPLSDLGELGTTAAAAIDGRSLLAQLAGSGVSLEGLERTLLETAVEECRGNLAAAARQLGITRAQLSYRLERKYPGGRAAGRKRWRGAAGGASA